MEFKELLGKTIVSIKGNVGDEEMIIECAECKTCGAKKTYKLYHDQSCCESVAIEDICGDLEDLIGNPILLAEEVTSDKNPEGVEIECQDSFTWTFYKLATNKGAVTIRWYGSSNGYYSESVDFEEVK